MIRFVGRRAIALHASSRFPQTLYSVRNYLLSIWSFSNPAGSSVSSTGLRFFLTEVVTSSEKNNTGGVKKKTNTLTSSDAEHGDTVFTMLRSYGFLESHIHKLLQKFPSLQTVNINIQKPKLDFFREMGFSGVEMGKMFSSDPQFLKTNLNNKLMPNFELLCKLLGGKDCALKVVKKTPRFIMGNVSNTLLPNIEILRKYGIVGENVTYLLNKHAISRLLLRKTEKLEEYVKILKEMDCDFSMKMYISALTVLGMYSNNRWDKKVSLFKGFGWSEGEFLGAFKRCPTLLGMADKKLKERLDFFMNKLNYTAAAISAFPMLLIYSFEKRIKPRCAVFNLLASNGKMMRLTDGHLFNISDEHFLRTYIMKYLDEIPELMDAFEGKLEFDGFELQCYKKSNIETLQMHCVPEDIVLKILKKNKKVMLVNNFQFREVMQGLKRMGFDFSTEQFVDALCVLVPMRGTTSRAKVKFYNNLGWSSDDFITTFKKQPNFVTVEDEKIRKIVHILEDTISWNPRDIATFPSVLLLDIESNIIPRCSIYKLLVSRKILEKKKPTVTFFKMSGHKFFKTYVEKYQKDVPEVLEVYNHSKESSKLVPVRNIIHV